MTTRLDPLLTEPVAVAVDATVADARRLLYADATCAGLVVLGESTGPRHVAADVLLRTPVQPMATMADVRCCPPLVLRTSTDVEAAAALALDRDGRHRSHDLLVWREDGSVGVLAAAQLLATVTRLLRTGMTTDGLTGLASRTTVTHGLHATFEHAAPGTTIAVAFLDLDGFKGINDQHGHAMGDRVLDVVGRRLGTAVRGSDLIGRMGGDEFLAVLHVGDAEEARAAGERLLARVAGPVEQGTVRLHIGLSVGVAVGEVGRDTPDQLLADADALMYLAKQRGGGVLVSHDSSEVVVTRSQLQDVLANGGLELRYQPIVPLDGSPFTSVEALVRWPQPDGSILPPDSFVPLAEATGQIVELDWWTLETAVRQLTVWDRAAPHDAPTSVHVNVSGRTLTVPGIISHVAQLLTTAEVAPGRLTLEITETAVIGNISRAATVLTSLREFGVQVAIDDFGVGESSLAQLAALPVSCLKIDRRFVAGLPEHGVERGVVELVRTLADQLGLSLVAEGVESEQQAVVLRELGVTHAQGWLWNPAMTWHAIRDLRRSAMLREAG